MSESVRKKIGARIRSARQAAGFTQVELGRRVALDQGHISRLEGGTYDGSPSQLLDIAHVLGVPVARLLEDRVADEADRPYVSQDPLSRIRSTYDNPPGLQALAGDGALIETLKITDAEWEALASLRLPTPVSKAGYVNLLFAIRAVSAEIGVTDS
jgi:transcriptional regulator with XRE-family HTH domain